MWLRQTYDTNLFVLLVFSLDLKKKYHQAHILNFTKEKTTLILNFSVLRSSRSWLRDNSAHQQQPWTSNRLYMRILHLVTFPVWAHCIACIQLQYEQGTELSISSASVHFRLFYLKFNKLNIQSTIYYMPCFKAGNCSLH